MNLIDQDIKKISLMIVAIALGIATFFLVKSVLIAVLGGLILAYICKPIYNLTLKVVRFKNLAALLVSLFVVALILIPLWFMIPIMLQQVFNLFTSSQSISYQSVVESIFPTGSPQFLAQVSASLSSFVGKSTSHVLESLNAMFINLPTISLHVVILFFVFFYAMRDSESLKNFAASLSPFTKSKEKVIIDEFRNVTDSIVYGQIVIGFVQGGLAGLGLLIFGIDNVLVLTFLAVFLSILPIIGPFLIWVPITLFLFVSGETNTAIGYLIYNATIVSFVDNILRMYLVSRKSLLSPAVVLVAMIGGFFFIGIIGFLIGPLIVSYFFMILHAYKEKSLQTLINEA